jgi:hypothetical protein
MARAAAIILLMLATTPAAAQGWSWDGTYDPYCPPGWCYQRPAVEQRRPVRHRTPREAERPAKHHAKPAAKVARAAPQRAMSHDDEREWLNSRVKNFCRRYPKDQACHPPESPKEP